jgi:hypothetical protein
MANRRALSTTNHEKIESCILDIFPLQNMCQNSSSPRVMFIVDCICKQSRQLSAAHAGAARPRRASERNRHSPVRHEGRCVRVSVCVCVLSGWRIGFAIRINSFCSVVHSSTHQLSNFVSRFCVFCFAPRTLSTHPRPIASFPTHTAKLTREMGRAGTILFRLAVPGLAENRPSVILGDRVLGTSGGGSDASRLKNSN